MGDITIDEDDLSDEYDFMDDDDEAGARRQQEKERRRTPQHKYKEVLQQLADRTLDEITVDLDDLHAVRGQTYSQQRVHPANRYAVGRCDG